VLVALQGVHGVVGERHGESLDEAVLMPDGTTLRYSMFLGTVRRAYRLAWPFLMSHAVRSIP